MGLNTDNIITDLDVNARITSGTLCWSYENIAGIEKVVVYIQNAIAYVDSSATGMPTTETQGRAFTDLQDALAVVRAGCVDTIVL